MTNGFIGTIGYIKGLLMSSSQTGHLINNDNFYPGSPDIPDTDPTFTNHQLTLVTTKSVIDRGTYWYFQYSSGYVDFLGVPNLNEYENWEIGFKGSLKSNWADADKVFKVYSGSTNCIVGYSKRYIDITTTSGVARLNRLASAPLDTDIQFIIRYEGATNTYFTQIGTLTQTVKNNNKIKSLSNLHFMFGDNGTGTNIALKNVYKDTLYCKTW